MADEQFFNDTRNDLDGDGIVDEKDIHIMRDSPAAQAKVERNMNEAVDPYNVQKIFDERKKHDVEETHIEKKDPNQELRDKVIANEVTAKEMFEFQQLVNAGVLKALTDEEKKIIMENKERQEEQAAQNLNETSVGAEKEEPIVEGPKTDFEVNSDNVAKTINEEEIDNQPKDKKVDEEELENETKDKSKTVDENEVENEPKSKKVNEEDLENETKPKDKKVDEEELDNKPKDKNVDTENLNMVQTPNQQEMTNAAYAQRQPDSFWDRSFVLDNGERTMTNREAYNKSLEGVAHVLDGFGDIGEGVGMLFKGGMGLASNFLRSLKKDYDPSVYIPPKEVVSAFNGVAAHAQQVLRELPPEFNNPITQAMIASFKVTRTRDVNVDQDGQGTMVRRDNSPELEQTEKMIKDRVVNENSVGLIASIHLAGGTDKDKEGNLFIKEDVANKLNEKLNPKEMAALGATLYAINNHEKLDISDKHINSVVEMAKGFDEPEKLEKSLNVLYEAGGREAAANPERNTESILVSPANVVNVAQALQEVPSIDTKAFDKQLDAVTKGVKDVTQVNHTMISKDAKEMTGKLLNFIHEREQNKGMDKGRDKERTAER